ncbi:nucleotidyltransferase family protein [Cypionkella sinensis]|uniref:Nucleotidyltransferase family protein n=1 Tax=Cypionkella sinensis TaxID=1756043 RepID=A0ABV7J0B8_9RHOB
MRPLPLMLFAAGFGTRMGALTQNRPKPLIEVGGKPLIDHALAMARSAGVAKIVVNLHYLGPQIAAHLHGSDIQLSWETEQILETGGGLRAALPLLGVGPVMTLNTDAVWSGQNPLTQLLAAWDPAKMDALLLLLPCDKALGHTGHGDFLLDPDGRISRANGADAPVYLGAQILKTESLSAISEPVFSLNRLWDISIANNRAFGLIHQGGWCDVGRPEGIALAESLDV